MSTLKGYKPGETKSADEYAKLDAEDESLARWKASLGIVPGATAPAEGPKACSSVLQSLDIRVLKVICHLGHCIDPGVGLLYASSWQENRFRLEGYSQVGGYQEESNCHQGGC